LETSDEDGDDNEAEAIVELDPEMTVRIDGKDVKVSEALELKADYTRKTQALAEERKAFEAERLKQVAVSCPVSVRAGAGVVRGAVRSVGVVCRSV
jgi:hypothetical protein